MRRRVCARRAARALPRRTVRAHRRRLGKPVQCRRTPSDARAKSNARNAAVAGDQPRALFMPGARRAPGVVLCAAELRGGRRRQQRRRHQSDQPARAAAVGDDGSRVRLPDALRDRNGTESNVHGLCRLLFEPLAPRPAVILATVQRASDVGGVARHANLLQPAAPPAAVRGDVRTLRRAASQFLSSSPRWPTA